MRSPCYDSSTKTDCPDRKPGCSSWCPEWKKYVEKRDKRYRDKRAENDVDSLLISGCTKRRAKYQKESTKGYRKTKHYD